MNQDCQQFNSAFASNQVQILGGLLRIKDLPILKFSVYLSVCMCVCVCVSVYVCLLECVFKNCS